MGLRLSSKIVSSSSSSTTPTRSSSRSSLRRPLPMSRRSTSAKELNGPRCQCLTLFHLTFTFTCQFHFSLFHLTFLFHFLLVTFTCHFHFFSLLCSLSLSSPLCCTPHSGWILYQQCDLPPGGPEQLGPSQVVFTVH